MRLLRVMPDVMHPASTSTMNFYISNSIYRGSCM